MDGPCADGLEPTDVMVPNDDVEIKMPGSEGTATRCLMEAHRYLPSLGK